jgi:hypothetical protein
MVSQVSRSAAPSGETGGDNLEVLVMRGKSAAVRSIADTLIATRASSMDA